MNKAKLTPHLVILLTCVAALLACQVAPAAVADRNTIAAKGYAMIEK